jgi:hypothetical protein
LVNNFKAYHIPVDILIVDMDWHETHGLIGRSKNRDEFGPRIGWTDYTREKFEKNFSNQSACFVKIVAKNTGICLEWHHQTVEKAWLLINEIEIN